MLKVTQDLVKGDQCAEELKITNEKVMDLKAQLSYKDSLIGECNIRDSVNANSLSACDTIKKKNESIILNLNTKVTNKNKELWVMRIIAAILTIVVVVK